MAAANLMMQNRINQEPSFGESMLQLLGMAGQGMGQAEGAELFSSAPAAAASDKRLKKNIVKVGEQNGYNIYTWDWIEGFDGGYNRGVIAQEVLEIMPQAVSVMENGYYGVNYSMIGV